MQPECICFRFRTSSNYRLGVLPLRCLCCQIVWLLAFVTRGAARLKANSQTLISPDKTDFFHHAARQTSMSHRKLLSLTYQHVFRPEDQLNRLTVVKSIVQQTRRHLRAPNDHVTARDSALKNICRA